MASPSSASMRSFPGMRRIPATKSAAIAAAGMATSRHRSPTGSGASAGASGAVHTARKSSATSTDAIVRKRQVRPPCPGAIVIAAIHAAASSAFESVNAASAAAVAFGILIRNARSASIPGARNVARNPSATASAARISRPRDIGSGGSSTTSPNEPPPGAAMSAISAAAPTSGRNANAAAWRTATLAMLRRAFGPE